MKVEPGNRRYEETVSEWSLRGPTSLEIALVRRLGGKVKLYAADFHDVRNVEVLRSESAEDGSVTLEVRHKSDARGKLIDLQRQQDGSYAEDPWRGL